MVELVWIGTRNVESIRRMHTGFKELILRFGIFEYYFGDDRKEES